MFKINADSEIVIIGAGVAGISAGFHLKDHYPHITLFEKENAIGGLCSNFVIDGFRFDKFVHFFFSENESVKQKILDKTEYYSHKPLSTNYYKNLWLKHPAQNNLYNLSLLEKIKVLVSFLIRKRKNIKDIKNYDEWLRCQYGDYFAQHFPIRYTEKYWCIKPENLETKWIGNRMYCPNLFELIRGMFSINKKNYYYGKNMRYPKKGGYLAFFEKFSKDLNIQINKEVINIDTDNKKIKFSDNSETNYDKLFSSIPLPEIVKIIDNIPEEIIEAGNNLLFTSGYIVSIGVKGKINNDNLWLYNYNKNTHFSRIYISSLKSPDNVPDGYSSMQAEIYFNNKNNPYKKDTLITETINDMVKMGLIKYEDIILKDIREIRYANIIFNHDIYKNREIILDYLKSKDIIPIGRFGKWEYFWSDEAFEDGKKEAEKYICQ